MIKKIKNIIKNNALSRLIPLLTLVFAANIFSMEPLEITDFEDSGEYYGESSEYSCEELSPLAHLFKPQPFKLATYDNKGGSVLPLYTGPNKKTYAILSREARGKDKRKYDDFSGGRETKDKHPMLSAAREFHEEAILQRTLGWNLEKTMQFLDPEKAKTTIVVVAYSKNKNPKNSKSKEAKNVTYIVDFNEYATKLFANFYHALAAERKYYRDNHISRRNQPTVEKDRIAGVLLSDLKDVIINSKGSKSVRVWANVIDPKTNSFYKEQITLRPFLVAKLRLYFLDAPYELGENAKIRHYKSYH